MKRTATIALAPVSVIYGIVVEARNAGYRRGFLRTRDVGVPVISIGNLTFGGTGKTTLVEWIARELASRGRRVGVLTRGYGREDSRQRVVASDGKEVLADIAQTGDEALMLAENLRGKAAVICDADRVSAAFWSIEHLGSDVFVLDDAFQHQRIARQLNIVTIDGMNPWGNRRLLPGGILREPISELSRADCVVITGAGSPDLDALRDQIEEISPSIPIFLSRRAYKQLRELGSLEPIQDSDKVKASPVAAFCAIGNPESFFTLLRREGYNLVQEQSFRDHHRYTQADLDRLSSEAQSKGAHAILTTAKDAVKLRALKLALPCYVVDVTIEIDRPEMLRELITKAIKSA